MNSTAPSPVAPRVRRRTRRLIAMVGVVVGGAVLVACGSDEDAFEPTTPLQEQVADVTIVLPEGETQPEILPPYTAGMPDGSIGQTIPTVSGSSLLTGEPMTIGPNGKAKVIIFLAHWCPHCQKEVPRIAEHLKENPLPDDVELVSVSTSVMDNAPNYTPQRWLEKEEWPVPTLADSSLGIASQAFGQAGFPFFLVVDADGAVVARTSGEKSNSQFDEMVEAARTGSV